MLLIVVRNAWVEAAFFESSEHQPKAQADGMGATIPTWIEVTSRIPSACASG
ncbi:hypothetical protein DSM3645_20477 [Blastopirellula marina DSM 3645]|uniref:Uncharacterized protein n=1 Tax=Blastopirellula marina DSM 3645 TaxID=314230 RepID=A3ZQP7_9BACT|nr:hypothetical protein DSM3645_20477 [Blastopirellula marina DSM 3645]